MNSCLSITKIRPCLKPFSPFADFFAVCRRMVRANKKDEAPKSESSPVKDEAPKSESNPEKDEAPKSESNPEKDEAPLNSISDKEEEEDEDEEEYYEEEEEEEDDDEREHEEEEEEKVNNGGNAVAVVNNEEVETNKENAVKEDEKKAKEPKNSEKSGQNSKNKEKIPGARNKNRKQDEQKESVTLAVNGDKPESSNKKKGSKRVESMGMVFMCSSKTKTDCFRYKILGLPENKKDQVLKIYKGMRLFLFDVDLRLMYGVFKAAGPGGYNIEPRAFKSEFPSQVRFTVLDDCVPLAEEKFKHVLKENYYARNKFESLLKADQVKKLCKLFVRVGRGGGRSKSAVKARRAQPVETRRIRRDEIRRNQPDDRITSRARETRKRRVRDEERRPRSPVREKRRYTDYDHERSRVLYDHEPPLPRYHPAPPPAAIGSPVRLYAYERQPLDIRQPFDIPPYVRDHVPDHHTFRVLDRDRSRDQDPYPVYSREPPLYHDTLYAIPQEHHHLVSRDYHPPAIRTPEYRIDGGSRVANYRDAEIARDYRSPALPLPEYRSTTRYRY
ncbi:hypothetical protein L1987_04189 [Smallanthus sonchifolius]|uniref:Uncharacterized protein n=1 Tax=Smallanthus sonchifolius TaxID=185202 RepID=A0ACB9KCL1_9ASTR|nr:hypothetical protein L1987_04189 [Smallanthus sonchifolius]